jgi:hypothetical protein
MKIAIFYHIAQMGLGAFVYQQQVHRLYTSGIIEAADYIHFGVNGDQELFNIPEKVKVKYNKKQNWGTEKETLLDLREFCKNNPEYKILYFHTKGATKSELSVHSWRLMMEYFTIDKWQECIKYLERYTCVGCHLGTIGPSIFSDGTLIENDKTYAYMGNFWWANASYINILKSRYVESECRMEKERWIGDSDSCYPKTLYNNLDFDSDPSNFNNYSYYFREKDYINY